MFVSFLLPYPVRYVEAPYLWVYYKQLCSLSPDEVMFVGSADYFQSPEYFMSQGRWEVRDEYHPGLDYRIPFPSDVTSSRKFVIDPKIFDSLERNYLSPNLVWRHLLTQDFEPLQLAFKEVLLDILQSSEIEAVLSLCNCPSIELAASDLGIPVIHNEIGPLREPEYVSTAYFDFRGVNGNTESVDRLLRYAELGGNAKHDQDNLLSMIAKDVATIESIRATKGDMVGVALQLPDDSNTMAFSNGFDAMELLRYVKHCFPHRELLIRAHPQDPMSLDYSRFGGRDASASAAEFIAKCDVIFTINSSLGFEALLLGRAVKAVGDSFYSFLADPRVSDRALPTKKETALRFLTTAYLLPYRNLFDPEYYRWRLQFPSEQEIYARHRDLFQEARQVS